MFQELLIDIPSLPPSFESQLSFSRIFCVAIWFPKLSPVPPPPVAEQPVLANSGWLWVKAWIFAVLHATTVSLVVGGMTFFEDLAKASTEIQQEGRVSFPKQLLPGTIAGSGPS